MKIILRIQWEGLEAKTLEPSNPGILKPYLCFKVKNLT